SPATNRTISAFRTLPRGKSERQTPGTEVSTWDFALGRGSGKMGFIAIFKNKANNRRNGTSLSSQKAKLSEKHIVSRSEGHPASSS
ncbi:hypothetical protein, partial [uncultured Gemmiger sp.]|uniref:hypothetical protein n=1 Tax=uncultured Gemmiger sp. TaxID=1623490 RepID=UPI0025E4503B